MKVLSESNFGHTPAGVPESIQKIPLCTPKDTLLSDFSKLIKVQPTELLLKFIYFIFFGKKHQSDGTENRKSYVFHAGRHYIRILRYNTMIKKD